MGDGYATAIGGNHFIHAARRNINLTAIIINNNIYGMTGGQYSPTTPYGMKATTAPYRNIEHAFNIAELAVTAGAVFVGRGTVYHARLLDKLIEKAFVKRGFGVVEVITHCHTQYGRHTGRGNEANIGIVRHQAGLPALKRLPGHLVAEGEMEQGMGAGRCVDAVGGIAQATETRPAPMRRRWRRAPPSPGRRRPPAPFSHSPRRRQR